MKIKEVMEQTGLTDWAIRLYISNGLLQPETKHSYTGRNSYEFSAENVTLLQKIALLRKADFSLEQIKLLQDGGQAAADMLGEYIEEKQEQQKKNEKILSVLKDIPADSEPTLDEVCKALEDSFNADTAVPDDAKLTLMERIEVCVFREVALLIAIFFLLSYISVIFIYKSNFMFTKIYTTFENHIGMIYLFIPIILMTVVFFLYIRKPKLVLKKRIIRCVIAIVLVALTIVDIMTPIGIAYLALVPPFYSETTKPKNYLVFDTYVNRFADDIGILFPAEIPQSAIAAEGTNYGKLPETTQYYYIYENVVEETFDVYAQWQLPEDEYIAEKQRISAAYPGGEVYKTTRGDWVCLHFSKSEVQQSSSSSEFSHTEEYYFIIFAYNDKTSTVRYITSYALDCGNPYFLTLDW